MGCGGFSWHEDLRGVKARIVSNIPHRTWYHYQQLASYPTILASIETTDDPDETAQLQSVSEFDEEFLINYELGYKGRLFDNTLNIQFAAFYTDYDDKQVSAFIIDPVFGSLTKIVNAPESVARQLTTRGAESLLLRTAG